MYARLTILLQIAKGKITTGYDGNGRLLIYVSEEVASNATVMTINRLITLHMVGREGHRFTVLEEGLAALDRNWPAWRGEVPNPK